MRSLIVIFTFCVSLLMTGCAGVEQKNSLVSHYDDLGYSTEDTGRIVEFVSPFLLDNLGLSAKAPTKRELAWAISQATGSPVQKITLIPLNSDRGRSMLNRVLDPPTDRKKIPVSTLCSLLERQYNQRVDRHVEWNQQIALEKYVNRNFSYSDGELHLAEKQVKCIVHTYLRGKALEKETNDSSIVLETVTILRYLRWYIPIGVEITSEDKPAEWFILVR